MLLGFTPFGGQSLETGLRLLAFVVCDLITLRPYVFKYEVFIPLNENRKLSLLVRCWLYCKKEALGFATLDG